MAYPNLEVESGLILDSPTPTDIRDHIPGEDHAILSRSEREYIQYAWDIDNIGHFLIEYRELSADAHYQATSPKDDMELIISAFCKYLAEDESWKNDFDWRKMTIAELEAAQYRQPRGCLGNAVAIIVLLGITGTSWFMLL